MKLVPGQHYTVKVGDWEYDTVIDDRCTQRFVGNGVLVMISNAMIRDYNNRNRSNALTTSIGYDDIVVAYENGEVSLKDMVDFYTGTRYSVGAFATLSTFEHLEIFNPVWEQYEAEQEALRLKENS